VVARLCIARQALRASDAKPKAIIKNFIKDSGGEQVSAPVLSAAALLALDAGDRLSHDQYRRIYLEKYADHPVMWTATAFFLDRYHRYWLYHPPFSAGWTYGRRMAYYLAIGTPEIAQRKFQTELKTLDGETVKIPESSDGKWTVISFIPTAAGNGFIERYTTFTADRPFEDVNLIAAVLDDDTDKAQKLLKEKEEEQKKKRRQPDSFPTLLIPEGMKNPIVRKLGILSGDKMNNLLILRPDGSIALASSGLYSKKGNVIQSVIELHDEKMVDEALAKGNLDEAKRLAFAYAPLEEPAEEGKKKKKAVKISVPHLRSRAKVYQAMGDLEAALADAEEAYLEVNSKAGHLSMRTEDLEETEGLRDTILEALQKQR
jgi:tetratricopeptide (TPR) repeat protein